MTDLERAFITRWRQLSNGAPDPQHEYRFAAHFVGMGNGIRARLESANLKDWRFDFAWSDKKVAVECEGGTYGKPVHCHNCGAAVMRQTKGGSLALVYGAAGRHGRGAGYRGDVEKYNAASIRLGWRIIRVTTDMLRDDPYGVVSLVLLALSTTP